MSCERLWQAQATDEGRLGPGDVAAFERHARSCIVCKRALAEAAELRSLTEALPLASPSELEARRLRARVLHDAMAPPALRARRVHGLVVGLAAALALLLLVVHARRQPYAASALAGTVLPDPGALFRQSREGDVERVVLTNGEIRVHVRKQGASERFLVMVPDGEVEVRGTTFEVAVHDGQTTRVHVDDGVVIVRLGETRTLKAGEDWPVQGSRPATSPGASPIAPPDASQGLPATSLARTPRLAEPAVGPQVAAALPPIARRAVAQHTDSERATPGDDRELPRLRDRRRGLP